MYSIKLVINTGIHWIDVVELPTFTGDIEAVMSVSLDLDHPIEQSVNWWMDRKNADVLTPDLAAAIADIENRPYEYSRFATGDVLAAREYLSKLLAACKYHPGCEVRVETI